MADIKELKQDWDMAAARIRLAARQLDGTEAEIASASPDELREIALRLLRELRGAYTEELGLIEVQQKTRTALAEAMALVREQRGPVAPAPQPPPPRTHLRVIKDDKPDEGGAG